MIKIREVLCGNKIYALVAQSFRGNHKAVFAKARGIWGRRAEVAVVRRPTPVVDRATFWAAYDMPAAHKFSFYAILALLLIATILTRCHSMDRSLWADEAWVANSVLEPTISETLYYRSWLQTSPPLFLMLLRLVVSTLGISNEAFRLVPVTFGILSVVLMTHVACRLLRPFFSLVAIFLFVFSPAVVSFSHVLKQYSTDVFVSLMLISAGLVYLHRPSRTNLYFWLGNFLVLAFVSYPALLFIPGLCFATVVDYTRAVGTREDPPLARAKWFDTLAVSICGFIVAAINYFFFILPNRQPQLDSWFELNSFYDASLWSWLLFYLKQLSDLPSLLFLQGVYWRHADLKVFLVKLVAVFVLLIGTGALCVRGTIGNRGDLKIAMFLAMPILCLYLLNALGLYPVGVVRLLLFLVPTIIILLVYGLQAISYGVSAVLAKAINLKQIDILDGLALLSLIILAAVFLLLTFANGLSPHFRHDAIEESEHAVRYLSERVEPPDILYVHASMREQFKLYSRLMPVSAKIVWGNIGWPCCPRDVSVDRLGESEDILREELAQLEIPATNSSVWLLFTDRPGHWASSGRRGPGIFAPWLIGAGCLRSELVSFRGVRIDKYQCNGTNSGG